MSKSYNFWSLINNYKVEIPTIQRDYTYGRASTEKIKEKLVHKILSAAKSNQKLHLDFIYGKLKGIENLEMLDRNKKNIETLLESLSVYSKTLNLEIDTTTKLAYTEPSEVVTFIPLDGQQRLTTLFLIHWYVAFKLKKEEANFNILSRFTYLTRVSSQEFLSLITSKEFVSIEVDRSIRDRIELNELFFNSWKKDPTVNGCLIVLDEIEKQLKDSSKEELQNIWENLVDEQNSLIHFDFFDLDNFQLTDELYVKMNARGKRLTDFENFKAWLIKKFSSSDTITVQNWKKKLDIQWNDVFWNNKPKEDTEIDDAYLRFFKQFYLGYYVKTYLNQDEIKKYSKKNEDILFGNLNELPTAIFEGDQDYDKILNESFEFLEIFKKVDLANVNCNQSFFQWNLQELFFTSYRMNWWHTSIFYAISRYIIKFKNTTPTELQQWVRVISNLIYNTPIESAKLYKNALISIDSLLQYLNEYKSIYECLDSVENIDFFDKGQAEEEKLKAKYCLQENGKEWEELFIRAENIINFHGQIAFIFELIEDINSIKLFENHVELLEVLFSEEILQRKDYVLFRSLCRLTNKPENVFLQKGVNFKYPLLDSTGTLRLRNENWRRYFVGNKLELIKKLTVEIIDANIAFNVESIQNYLIQKLDESSNQHPLLNVIIKNPQILEYPKLNEVRPYGKTYYLLIKSRIYGWYRELFTYAASIEFGLNHIRNKNESNLLNTGVELENGMFIYLDYVDGLFKVRGHDELIHPNFPELLKLIENEK